MSNPNFNQIFSISTKNDFTEMALNIFKHQYATNEIYGRYVKLLGIDPSSIQKLEEIPFLPIDFFKYHHIKSGSWEAKEVFYSSGTTLNTRSAHFQKDDTDYLILTRYLFEKQYGSLEHYIIVALLPSYVENGGSSLVKMTDFFIKESKHALSGFYLGDSMSELHEILNACMKVNNRKVMLFGVSYALLDLALEKLDLSNALVMETGGMKGRRKEMIREDLHKAFCEGFNVNIVHSEYGMTELMSQFYSQGHGVFNQSHTARVLIREVDDPFSYVGQGSIGGINVIDLANIHSCSFIETKDLGKIISNDQFMTMGRFDNSDIRGCNLLYDKA